MTPVHPTTTATTTVTHWTYHYCRIDRIAILQRCFSDDKSDNKGDENIFLFQNTPPKEQDFPLADVAARKRPDIYNEAKKLMTDK